MICIKMKTFSFFALHFCCVRNGGGRGVGEVRIFFLKESFIPRKKNVFFGKDIYDLSFMFRHLSDCGSQRASHTSEYIDEYGA